MIILVDDQRTYNADYVARNFRQAIEILEMCKKIPIDLLMLDHDLGSRYPRETGEAVLDYVLDNNLPCKIIQIVSSNPCGKLRMEQTLRHRGWIWIEGTSWKNPSKDTL
jgi:hypothetical protein